MVWVIGVFYGSTALIATLSPLFTANFPTSSPHHVTALQQVIRVGGGLLSLAAVVALVRLSRTAWPLWVANLSFGVAAQGLEVLTDLSYRSQLTQPATAAATIGAILVDITIVLYVLRLHRQGRLN